MATPWRRQQPPPEQEQAYPGQTGEMDPRARDEMVDYEGRGLLAGTHALITSGDPGIGRAVAGAFAKEGADVAIAYLSGREGDDAAHTADLVGKAGRRCVTIRGDLAEEDNCQRAVDRTMAELGGLDLLVNNVATQQPVADLAELSTGQWERAFQVNIFSYFWTTPAALKHLPEELASLARRAPLALAGAGATAQIATAVGARLIVGDPVTEAERAGWSR